MAHIEVNGFDDVLRKLDKLSDQGKVEAIAKKAVEAAQPMNESAMRAALASVEHGPYSTGSVSASISSTGTKVNSYGVYAVARPTGRDAKGERNGAKAAYLQYGTSRMQARPWREKAVHSAEGPCTQTIESILTAEMELE